MRKFITHFTRNKSGASGVEMALVTPLLILILFGSFELGNYFWNEHIVVKGVRDATRFAGRQPFSKYDCASVTDSNLETQIKNLARTGNVSGGTARVTGWADTHVTVSVSCDATVTTGIYTTQTGGAPIVTVSAIVPYNSVFAGFGFFEGGGNLRANAQTPVMGI